MRAFQTAVENNGLFAVFREDRDGDARHESISSAQGHATNFLCWGQVTFVIEGDSTNGRGGWELRQPPGEKPARQLVHAIVRQNSAVVKVKVQTSDKVSFRLWGLLQSCRPGYGISST